MKKVFCFDYNNVYVGPVEAELCQMTEMKRIEQATRGLKKGEKEIEPVYLMPAMSTEVEPLPEKKGSVQKFDGQKWVYEKIKEQKKENTFDEMLEEIRKNGSAEDKRRLDYPPFTEYLDGIVKQGSGVPELIEKGKKQVEKYINDCLAVKKKYPKPDGSVD